MNVTTEQNDHLAGLLCEELQQQNGIPFVDFMQRCLYHPDHGYYMTPRQRIGKEGDFFTSSSVHHVFGRLIARQVAQTWELLGKGPMTVAEQGAGDGFLALDILDGLAEEAPDCYRQLRYCLVEVSPGHQQRQRQTLEKHADRVEWCALDDLSGMQGCFLSNELVDAFAVHLMEKRDGELQEVFVIEQDGEFVEELRAPSTPALQAHFDWLGCGPIDGNRFEVNLAAVDWMRRVGQVLDRGLVLTIDYGYPAGELYAPFRRSGTLLCYQRHSSSANPYVSVGCQDITSHVDFTALQKAGGDVGLATLWFGEQYRFLLALGFVETLMELQARESSPLKAQQLRMTLKNLIMPEGGMGETFKVLVQAKGLGTPELLCQRPISAIPI
jgi:SAM-dependent MidA family methyltransferase